MFHPIIALFTAKKQGILLIKQVSIATAISYHSESKWVTVNLAMWVASVAHTTCSMIVLLTVNYSYYIIMLPPLHITISNMPVCG